MGTTVCGGSNLRAPLKMDFLRALAALPDRQWPPVYLSRDGSGAPLCFRAEAEVGDALRCIGVAAADEALVSRLRGGAVEARVASACLPDGTPCPPDAPGAWGFIAEYASGGVAGPALEAALLRALAEGRGEEGTLREKQRYLARQAVPEAVAVRAFDSMAARPLWPDMVPDPPVRFEQESAMGELTRALSYRLTGLHLRLVGSKGAGKNTLMQTVDWLLNVPQYRMQGSAELDKLDLLGGPTIKNGSMSYRLSDMLTYLQGGADVVLDEGNTIKPECADVLHSLTDFARCIQVPGYGLVRMAPCSAFTITMNEDYAGTNYMNEATVDRFTPIHMSQPAHIREMLRRVVPSAPENSLRCCDAIYGVIRDMIRAEGGLESEAMTIRGFIDALRAEPLLGLKAGLLDNVAGKPQDLYTRLQLAELIEGAVG